MLISSIKRYQKMNRSKEFEFSFWVKQFLGGITQKSIYEKEQKRLKFFPYLLKGADCINCLHTKLVNLSTSDLIFFFLLCCSKKLITLFKSKTIRFKFSDTLQWCIPAPIYIFFRLATLERKLQPSLHWLDNINTKRMCVYTLIWFNGNIFCAFLFLLLC